MRSRALVGALASLVVAGLVVAGLFAIGSPATAREYRADQERRSRLSQLQYVLASHVRTEGSLPSALDQVDEHAIRRPGYGFDTRKDPEIGEYFEYRKLAGRRYEICANFHHSSDDRRAREYGAYPGDVSHKPGRNCYDRTISAQDVESAPDFREGVSPPLREVPLREPPSPSSTVRPGASPEASPTRSV